MTPEDAKTAAQEVIDANTYANSSYTANGGLVKAASMASLVMDQASQLEAALAEIAGHKKAPAKHRKGDDE